MRNRCVGFISRYFSESVKMKRQRGSEEVDVDGVDEPEEKKTEFIFGEESGCDLEEESSVEEEDEMEESSVEEEEEMVDDRTTYKRMMDLDQSNFELEFVGCKFPREYTYKRILYTKYGGEKLFPRLLVKNVNKIDKKFTVIVKLIKSSDVTHLECKPWLVGVDKMEAPKNMGVDGDTFEYIWKKLKFTKTSKQATTDQDPTIDPFCLWFLVVDTNETLDIKKDCTLDDKADAGQAIQILLDNDSVLAWIKSPPIYVNSHSIQDTANVEREVRLKHKQEISEGSRFNLSVVDSLKSPFQVLEDANAQCHFKGLRPKFGKALMDVATANTEVLLQFPEGCDMIAFGCVSKLRDKNTKKELWCEYVDTRTLKVVVSSTWMRAKQPDIPRGMFVWDKCKYDRSFEISIDGGKTWAPLRQKLTMRTWVRKAVECPRKMARMISKNL